MNKGCSASCIDNDRSTSDIADATKKPRAIGNAPTALFHLLERLADWDVRPAAVLGFPVGFVGAAESKDALADNPFGLPYLVLRGRRGGSAIAAAALNALAGGVPEEAAP